MDNLYLILLMTVLENDDGGRLVDCNYPAGASYISVETANTLTLFPPEWFICHVF